MSTPKILRVSSATLIVAAGLINTALLNTAGCNSAAPPADTPPDVPPQSTMLMDFSALPGTDAKATARVQQPFPGTTALYAGGNLVVWNTIITVTLAVPVAAFVASFNTDPVQLDDGRWQWSYSFMAAGDEFTAKLQADVSNNGVDWFMLVSRSGAYTDFEWFTGHSNLAGTTGAWTLNYPPGNDPENPRQFIFIEWSRDANGDTAQIKYTNVTENAPENGGYIEYGITDNTTYDAFYTIASAGDDHTIAIEFNTDTIAGRVRDEIHFNDADWHCWDTDFQNTECP
ncbi:MAG TPA: hypothetical protein P5572_15870 [Phycisphaerae bacterium]|nr:hypothetical protein [Phycisphaerales bacterium]HRX86500.1 hypothetical protein [Phycisphaerae bacterium]